MRNRLPIRRNMKSTLASSGLSLAADELFAVMQRAHTQAPAHKFVRDIKTAPEPAIVLAEDQQLQDLVHFGTSVNFGIVTIDPMFRI